MNERIERLEKELQVKMNQLKQGKVVSFTIHPDDYRWLIDQAKLVEELENLNILADDTIQIAKQEIKRYKEALEEIRDPHPLNGIETASLIAQRALEKSKRISDE